MRDVRRKGGWDEDKLRPVERELLWKLGELRLDFRQEGRSGRRVQSGQLPMLWSHYTAEKYDE